MDKRTFYRVGYNLAIKNADSLLKISELSAINNEMGIATSLSVLAAEEALKAHFLLLQSVLPDIQIKDFDQIFQKHTIKHKNIMDILILRVTDMEQLKEILRNFSTRMEVLKLVGSGLKGGIEKQLSQLIDNAEKIKNGDYSTIPENEIINWSKDANKDKNDGFYVGISEDKWNDPRKIKEERFKQNVNMAKLMIQHTKQFAGIFDLTDLYEQSIKVKASN